MPFIKESWLKHTCEVLDATADPDLALDEAQKAAKKFLDLLKPQA